MRLLITVCCMVLTVSGDGNNDRAKSNIVYNFEKQLRSFMQDSVNYSAPKVNNNYESSARFQPRGMGHLYNVTDMFMRVVQKKDALPEGFLTVQDGQLQAVHLRMEWRHLLAHYGGVAAVVACGLLFAVALPCVGLFFCCCRCSGRCGARSQPFEKRHDRCKRITLGILLSGVTIVILFGVVCSFVTNAFVQEGVTNLSQEARMDINDTRLFLDNAKLEVDNLLLKNYEQLQDVLNKALSQSGVIVSDQLAEMSNATSLESLTALVRGLESIEVDLAEIKALTADLKDSYVDLNDELTVTREGLLDHLKNCSAAVSCQTMMHNYNISHLTTDEDFNALPDITDQLLEMDSFKDISDGVEKGRREFRRVQREIQVAVEGNTDEIRRSLVEAGAAIARIDADMVRMLDEVKRTIAGDKVNARLDEVDELVVRYAPIRYYVDMGMNCVLLMVLVCLTFGLFYGFCGRRPDGPYGDDCCNKATGGKCLMIAVWLAFVFGAVLTVLTVVFFLAGVATERVVCEPLRNPSTNQLMGLVDQLVRIDKLGPFPEGKAPDITVSQLITSCHQNRSLYTVLALENVFNISQIVDYEERYRIREKLAEFRNNIQFTDQVILLDTQTRDDLDRLSKSKLSDIDFPKYTAILRSNVVAIDLMELARALNKTARDIQMNPRVAPHIREAAKYFQKEARKLEVLQRTTVSVMQQKTRELDKKAKDLEEHLTFNNSSLNAAVAVLLVDLEGAQKYLDESMGEGVQEIAQDFTDQFLLHVNHYLGRVVNQTQENVGRCGPISSIYNSTLVATCDNVLRPFNGFWSSYGWCLLLFIPMIFLCVQLASLYQKSEPYPGPLVESVHDKKNHHRSYHETYDNTTAGYLGGGDYGRAAPAGQSQARYTDMAPKHWDYPAAVPPSGSPRYHSPPLSTEYERPPPYYYPGPGEHNHR